MSRTINFQTISWFWDLYNRNLLELDPPYQRRSVWNQDYKDFFIDTYSQEYLDKAFSDRDISWDAKEEVENEFRNTVKAIKEILDLSQDINLSKTRLKNQADFYSLFGAIAELNREEKKLIINRDTGIKINNFLKLVGDAELKNQFKDSLTDDRKNALDYYGAVKFSFTDAGPRKTRIKIMKSVIQGNIN